MCQLKNCPFLPGLLVLLPGHPALFLLVLLLFFLLLLVFFFPVALLHVASAVPFFQQFFAFVLQ